MDNKALPAHLQLQTKATSTVRERVRAEIIGFLPDVRGKFGFDEEGRHPVTIGMNKRGGMTDIEFEKYLFNSIVPLYPHSKCKFGHWVIIKVDSGPGQMGKSLLVQCRHMGFILFPRVPNSTAMTQETDCLYDEFKTTLHTNLDLLVQARIEKGCLASFPPWLCGIVIFGGTDQETGFEITESASKKGFLRVACWTVFAKIGVTPLTMVCLTDKNVRPELGDKEDRTNIVMNLLKEANTLAVFHLESNGYNGDLLASTIGKVPDTGPITIKHSQARVKLLVQASTHGSNFCVTGGGHLTTNGVFKLLGLETRAMQVKPTKAEKKERLKRMEWEDKGRSVLQWVGWSTSGCKPVSWNLSCVDMESRWQRLGGRQRAWRSGPRSRSPLNYSTRSGLWQMRRHWRS